MNRKIDTRLLITVIGITVSVLSFTLADKIDTVWKISIIGFIFLVVLIGILFTTYSEKNWKKYKDLPTALEELDKFKPTEIYIYTYVGNFIYDHLKNKTYEHNTKIKLLNRNPETNWEFPKTDDRQQIRKNQIKIIVKNLNSDTSFNYLSHQLKSSSDSDFVRFYNSEPSYRAVVAKNAKGKKVGYFGFYPLQVKKEGIVDFSGTKRPVFKITDEELLNDFLNWFEFYWENVAQRVDISKL